MDSIQLEEWIEQTDALRAKLYAFGKSPLPLESGERHQAWMLYQAAGAGDSWPI